MKWLICTLLCLGYAAARHEEYDGHALFSVNIQNAEEAEYFNTLEYPLDIWQYGSQIRNGLVLVPKSYIQVFQNELYSKGMEFIIEVENIKESLELEDQLLAERKRNKAMRAVNSNGPVLSFDEIYNLTQVNDYLEQIAQAYPNVVTLVNGGQSVQGRDINYLKISTTNFEDTSKPIVFFESLLHAREWVTLPSSLYAIDKLVVNVTESDLINDFDWIILPVANPDGYEYSHTTNRFWRKNMRTGVFAGDACFGVDLNRNFDVFYGSHSSNFACTEVYHGTSAFSEPEARVVRDILSEYEGRIELFIDVHSFGSMILYGWGTGNLPSNAFALQAAGLQMAGAIDSVKAEYNPNYRVGNSALVLYQASGTANDYGLVAGVPLSYVYELPGYRGVGQTIFGFLVHPDFIEQAGMETWEGIKAGARYARSTMKLRY